MKCNASNASIELVEEGHGWVTSTVPRLTMEKPKDAKNTLKKLIGYIGRNRYLFFALIGVMLIITLLNLAAPSIQQIAIDCITLTKKKASVDFSALGKTLIGLGAVYLLSSVFTYMQGIFSAKLSQYTVKIMRKRLVLKPCKTSYKISRYPQPWRYNESYDKRRREYLHNYLSVYRLAHLRRADHSGNSCHNGPYYPCTLSRCLQCSLPYSFQAYSQSI